MQLNQATTTTLILPPCNEQQHNNDDVINRPNHQEISLATVANVVDVALDGVEHQHQQGEPQLHDYSPQATINSTGSADTQLTSISSASSPLETNDFQEEEDRGDDEQHQQKVGGDAGDGVEHEIELGVELEQRDELVLNEADESGVDRFTVVAVQRDDGPSTKAVSLANLLLAASSISTFGSTSQSQLSATKVIGDSDEEKQIVKGILTDRDGGRNLEQGEEQDRKIEKFPFAQTFRLILIGLALTTITNFPSAFMHTSVNTAVAELNAYLHRSYAHRGSPLEPADVSLIRSGMHSVWYAGQVLGAACSPFICDRYGRKPAYLLATAMMAGACLLQMTATLFPYPELMIVGRLLASVFSPMSDAVAILYFQEISPVHLRGTLSSLFATGYSAMALLGMVFGMEHVLGHSLTILFSVPVVPGLLALLFLAWIPETPKFLAISKKDIGAALRSLQFYQGKQALTTDLQDAYQDELCDAAASPNNDNGYGSILSILTVAHLRKALFLSVTVMVLTLPFYPILQSSTYLLLSLGVPSHLAQLSSTGMMVLLTVCCVVAAFLIERFPRRRLLFVTGIGAQLSLLVFVVCASLLPSPHKTAEEDGWLSLALRAGATLGLSGYIVCYGLAVGPISYFIAPELVPLQNRSSMFCLCFGLASALIVITTFSTLPLYELIGPLAFVPLFIVPAVFALLYLHAHLPETKDRDTPDIVAALKGGGGGGGHRKRRRQRNLTENLSMCSITAAGTIKLGGGGFPPVLETVVVAKEELPTAGNEITEKENGNYEAAGGGHHPPFL